MAPANCWSHRCTLHRSESCVGPETVPATTGRSEVSSVCSYSISIQFIGPRCLDLFGSFAGLFACTSMMANLCILYKILWIRSLYIFFQERGWMDHCCKFFFARRDPKRFTQQMPASVDVPFALLVYAFRFTTIYMLALNVKCGCSSANRRFSYICPVCIVRRLVITVMQAMPSLSSFVFAHKFLMEFPKTYPRRILVLCGCGRTVSQSKLANQFFGLRQGARWLLMSSGRCPWAIWLHVFFSFPSLTATFAHWKCHILLADAKGWNKKQRYRNRNGMDVGAIGEATSTRKVSWYLALIQ